LFIVGEESLVSRSPQPTVNNFAAPSLARGEQMIWLENPSTRMKRNFYRSIFTAIERSRGGPILSPCPPISRFSAKQGLAAQSTMCHPQTNPAVPAERITLPFRSNELGETFAAGIRSERETNSQMPPLRRLDYKAFAALGSAGSTTT
jgi:hypothetical protein